MRHERCVTSMPSDSRTAPAVIDLRTAAAYGTDRPVGAVRLLPADLVGNPHLLPLRSCPLVIVGETESVVAPLIDALRQAERLVLQHYPEESWRQHLPAETGPPSRVRLWEPARVVEIATIQFSPLLPGKRALDLACGTGRNAVYLAMAGFDVTAIDILPDALQRTRDLASRYGVTVQTLERDLEKPGALDDLQADLIIVVRYLERALFPAIDTVLSPGGILAYETFTEAQRELGHPRNPRFLLQAGELRSAFARLHVLLHERVFENAHLERLIARHS